MPGYSGHGASSKTSKDSGGPAGGPGSGAAKGGLGKSGAGAGGPSAVAGHSGYGAPSAGIGSEAAVVGSMAKAQPGYQGSVATKLGGLFGGLGGLGIGFGIDKAISAMTDTSLTEARDRAYGGGGYSAGGGFSRGAPGGRGGDRGPVSLLDILTRARQAGGGASPTTPPGAPPPSLLGALTLGQGQPQAPAPTNAPPFNLPGYSNLAYTGYASPLSALS